MKKIGLLLIVLIVFSLTCCNSNIIENEPNYTLLPEDTWWDEQSQSNFSIKRSEIKTISFVKIKPEGTPVTQWNADVQKLGYVQCCIYGAPGDYDLYFVGNKIEANPDSAFLFFSFGNLYSISFNHFDTSNVTTMEEMFCKCSSLESLDLRCFNLSKVSNFNGIFNFSAKVGTTVKIDPYYLNFFMETELGHSGWWTYSSGEFTCLSVPDGKCTVSFYNHADKLQMKIIKYNEYLSPALFIPQQDGQTFLGWYYNENCTDYFDGSKPIKSNISLYSKWTYGKPSAYVEANVLLTELQVKECDKVTIIFSVQDYCDVKSVSISNEKTKIVVFNTFVSATEGTIEVNVVSAEGIIKGHFLEKLTFENQDIYDIKVLEEQTKYHSVCFKTNGGSVISNQIIKEGKTVSKPYPDPTKKDHLFVSWYTNSDFTGTAYDFNNPVTSDLTLYAKWKEEKTTEKWCVMAYMDFCNLQDFAMLNLDEICSSCPNENVKAYFLTGGSITSTNIEDYPNLAGAIQAFNPTDPFGPSARENTYQFWEYTKDGKFVEISPVTKGMNNHDVLSDFIDQCYYLSKEDNPNADYKYILELWNHGGGSYVGLIGDSAIKAHKYEDCIMSLSKCANAIKKSTKNNNFKFEAVVFDMCSMQSIEVAHAISYESTNYIIGSQTASLDVGSAYTDWFNFLYNHPQANGYEFGKVFCDTAYSKIRNYGNPFYIGNVTWSVLDMSAFEKLEIAFESYVASDLNTVSSFDVQKNLEAIDLLPAFSGQNGEDCWTCYMYDINVFTSTFVESDKRLALIRELEDAIIYKKYGVIQENAQCSGLSMCILTDKSDWDAYKYSKEWNNAYLEDCLSPNYRAFQKRISVNLSAFA